MTGFHQKLLGAASHYDHSFTGEDYYSDYMAKTLDNAQDVGQTILGFLIDWGGPSTARNFPIEARSKLENQLERWFEANHEKMRDLSQIPLWDSDLADIGFDICELFDSLMNIRQEIAGKNLRFGSTGAAKTLHLLLPKLFMIWDGARVRATLRIAGDAWTYLTYLRAQQLILMKAIDGVVKEFHFDRKSAVIWIEESHRKGLLKPSNLLEPATKILDEAVYDSSFGRKVIRPLLRQMQASPWQWALSH